MKSKVGLENLRHYFGKLFPHDRVEEHRRGKRYRKIYRSTRERWLISPTRWQFRTLQDFGTPNPAQIKAIIDKRDWLDIKKEIEGDIQQLSARAAARDEIAIQLLIYTALKATQTLEWLETILPEMMRSVAEESSEWPVLLSPNQKDIKRAKERVTRLRVGSNALTPKRSSQHLNPGAFWTRLAIAFYETCKINRWIVPHMLDKCKGVKANRHILRYWKTKVKADFYHVDSVHCFEIKDWARACVKLPKRIANESDFKAWSAVLKKAVVEYWHANPQRYQEALRQIGRADDKEYDRRNMAINSVVQAFRSLTGV